MSANERMSEAREQRTQDRLHRMRPPTITPPQIDHSHWPGSLHDRYGSNGSYQFASPTPPSPIADPYPNTATTPSRPAQPAQPAQPVAYYTPGAVEEELGDPQQLQQQQQDNPGPTHLIIDPALTGQTNDNTNNSNTQTASNTPEAPPLELTHSPQPTSRTLASYTLWTVNESYNMLGQSYDLADWSFQPSVEFEQTGANARTAEWDARGGARGIGLDAELHTLYPRDVGMASPVVEDNASRQVFRLGRREVRARGDAQISYKDINGLLVWRIMVPADARSQLATCYYTAIVGDQAIVFVARYDKDRPQQMDGFDAMLGTLQYNGAANATP